MTKLKTISNLIFSIKNITRECNSNFKSKAYLAVMSCTVLVFAVLIYADINPYLTALHKFESSNIGGVFHN